jgi:hypothetical protein
MLTVTKVDRVRVLGIAAWYCDERGYDWHSFSTTSIKELPWWPDGGTHGSRSLMSHACRIVSIFFVLTTPNYTPLFVDTDGVL